MKKIGGLLVFVILFSILSLQFVLAETTFFEGDLGYRDDFIMAPVPEGEIIIDALIFEETIETFVGGGGFYIRKKQESITITCPIIAESLKKHIEEKRNIDFSEREIEIMLTEINQKIKIRLSSKDFKFILDNYEDTCDSYYPLLGGLIVGRVRNLLNPFILIISIIVLLFIIILGNIIIRVLRKRGYGKRKKRKRK